MKIVTLLTFSILSFPLQAQTIEGFWQDIAGRSLFQRGASPSDSFGAWSARALDQTYPHAKEIRRSGAGYEVLDLNFDDADYRVKVLSAADDRIEFIRMTTWVPCAMRHRCSLQGEELFCSMERMCYEEGKHQVDWRGEERYTRRSSCERDGRQQLLGIPVRCR